MPLPPCRVAVLSDPIMSLIDTACIGQFGTSVQVAAVGPASSFFMLVFVLTGFVGVAVTNVVASSQVNAAVSPAVRVARQARANRAISHGLLLALTMGALLSAATYSLAPTLLQVFGATGDVLAPAVSYTIWRAAGTPAMLALIVCQGASLGVQDATTPFKFATGAAICEAPPHCTPLGERASPIAALLTPCC